jgi:4,5-DOPA dioxygenase extradiol
MIYDMYGFPPELYRVQYDASGSREIAEEIFSLLGNPKISLDSERGFDHGVWSTLVHVFPE